MSTVNNHRIVVRRKKARGGKGHTGGSWKIAYADFITAMMAFFLVMWLLSIVPHDQLKGIAEYFRMPLSVAIVGGPSSSAETSAIPGGGHDPTLKEGEVHRNPKTDTVSPNSAAGRDKRRLENLKQRIENLIDTSVILKKYRPQLKLDITDEGLRIQIIDSKNRPMFATGRADVQPYMRDILRELGPVLNDLPNKISIAGHTDAAQYARGERAYSNWELSADRANASRQELIAGGLNEGRVLRIVGMASVLNYIKEDPYAAVNRRISLVVLNADTQKRIENQSAATAMPTASSAQQAEAILKETPHTTPASVDTAASAGKPTSADAPASAAKTSSAPVPAKSSETEKKTSTTENSATVTTVISTSSPNEGGP